jgi:uncharacterized protein
VPVETVVLHTVDGLALVGELALTTEPVAAAVVCHPHPLYGGTMHNAVVGAVVDALVDGGAVVLRFNFRGAGGSQGSHADGVDERLDVSAALDTAAPFAGDGPVLLAGYSFGGAVALDVVDPRVDGWLAVAAPLRRSRVPLAGPDHRPKHLLVPAHDQYLPPAAAAEMVAGWPNTTVETVPGTDHFLSGRLQLVAAAADALLRRLVAR